MKSNIYRSIIQIAIFPLLLTTSGVGIGESQRTIQPKTGNSTIPVETNENIAAWSTVKLQVDSIIKKIPNEASSPNETSRPNKTLGSSKFIEGLRPLLIELRNSQSDKAHTVAALKVSEYISSNAEILNDSKQWANPIIAKQAKKVLTEFGGINDSATTQKLQPMSKWCWHCLGEFIESIFFGRVSSGSPKITPE